MDITKTVYGLGGLDPAKPNDNVKNVETFQLSIEEDNRVTIEQQAITALNTNKTFLAIAAPTQAQTLAQVKMLTRQNNGIIRLILQRFDGTD